DALPIFARRDPEEPFLQDRVPAVPEGGREDQELVAVADPGNGVLAPAIGLAPRQVMRQKAPGVPVWAIILPDGGPRPIAHIGPPAAPAGDLVANFPDPFVLFCHHGNDPGSKGGAMLPHSRSPRRRRPTGP